MQGKPSTAQEMHGAGIHLHHEEIIIRCNRASIIRDVARIFPVTRPVSLSDNTCIGDSITVIQNRIHHVYHNEDLVYTGRSYAEALMCIERLVHSFFLGKLDHLLCVHAGAVSFRNAGILFPASNEVGKSTFVLHLTARGIDYYSDEIGLVDIAKKRLYPYPKSISLVRSAATPREFDNGAIHVIEDMEKTLFIPESGESHQTGGAPLKYIFFLKRDGETTHPLSPCSRGRGLVELIRNSFNPLTKGASDFVRLVDLLPGIEMFFLNISNLDNAYNSIREVVHQ